MNCIIDAWDKHETELRYYLINKLNNQAIADDILQDVFLKAITQGAKFCSVESPRAWLFQVTRNHLIDYFRKQKIVTELDENIPVNTNNIATVETLSSCLPHALDKLTETDRLIIKACDIEGMSQITFSETYDLSLPATKSRIQRARRRLKQQLDTLCKVRLDEAGNVCCYDASQCNET